MPTSGDQTHQGKRLKSYQTEQHPSMDVSLMRYEETTFSCY
nr:MAG TPA: hypothetical protein [Caudoviricetes sp.]